MLSTGLRQSQHGEVRNTESDPVGSHGLLLKLESNQGLMLLLQKAMLVSQDSGGVGVRNIQMLMMLHGQVMSCGLIHLTLSGGGSSTS